MIMPAIGMTMPSQQAQLLSCREGHGGTNFPFASVSGTFSGCRESDIIKTHLPLAFQHEMRMCWESRALPAFREEQFKH